MATTKKTPAATAGRQRNPALNGGTAAARAATPTPASAPTISTLLGAPGGASLWWLDANAQLVGGWLEWQSQLWQPWLDWQGAVAQQMGQQLGQQLGEPWSGQWLTQALQPWLVRGTEQLA